MHVGRKMRQMFLVSTYCHDTTCDTHAVTPALFLCCGDTARACTVPCRRELYGEWDYDEFRRLHLKEYIVMCEVIVMSCTLCHGPAMMACSLRVHQFGILS